jgi:hypothetical protein
MKKLSIILISLALVISFAGSAMAESYYSVSGSASALTSDIVVKSNDAGQGVIQYMNFTGGAATTDVVLYQADATETTFSADEAAGQTALSLVECGGLDDDDYLVLMSGSGKVIEATKMSACNDTTNVATVSATQNAYKQGDKVYEMISAGNLYADVGTGETAKNGSGAALVASRKSKPVAFLASGSAITFHVVSGFITP